jgi:hypothetical protein
MPLEVPISDLAVASNTSPGDWIAPRLHGKFGAVTLSVPSGYAGYVRVCHPAHDPHGKMVRWAEVAQATGRKAHPLMQWHAIVGSSDSDNFRGLLWDGQAPDRGNLALPQLEELCELLSRHTADTSQCFVGLWMGWDWIEGGSTIMRSWREANQPWVTDSSKVVAPAFSTEELRRACLKLPDRDYVLLTGPLSCATRIRDSDRPKLSRSQSPNLFWPADRGWFVASEIDFDSTLVGGSADLVRSILSASGLDAWQVGPDDSLAANADIINRVAG